MYWTLRRQTNRDDWLGFARAAILTGSLLVSHPSEVVHTDLRRLRAGYSVEGVYIVMSIPACQYTPHG
jgi:hypothetical protein